MTRARMAALVIALVAAGAATSGAQRADTTRADTSRSALACPREGTMARAWADAAGNDARQPARTATGSRQRGAIDTVITLDITDRRWQRDSLAAGVSLGAAGTVGARRAPWHACAGANATLARISATLHDVHGRIHLKADPAALDAIGRTAGTTPPAPPRR